MKINKITLGLALAAPMLMTSLPSQAVVGDTNPPEINYESCETVLKAREDAAKSWTEVLDNNRKVTLGQGVSKDVQNLENCGNQAMKAIKKIQSNIKNALNFLSGGFSGFDLSSFISSYSCQLAKEMDKQLSQTIKSSWSNLANQYTYSKSLPYGFGKVKVGLNGSSVSGLISKDAKTIGKTLGSRTGKKLSPIGAIK